MQQRAQTRVRIEAHTPQQGDLVLIEQGPRVHIVLHQAAGNHHIAHVHIRVQATGQPREQHARHLEFPDDNRRRRGRRHLADAAKRNHARRAP
ncbi:hypothetical protein D3C71_2039250 [compost metagenome]